MLIPILLMIAGLLILGFGAEFLVSGSSRLAIHFGISPLVVGLTIVAFGTSAPELAVSILSALNDHTELALGNVIGSNIANIGLILGITALLCPIRIELEVVKRQIPFVILSTLLLGALLWNRSLSNIDGGLLVVGLIAFIVHSYRQEKAEDIGGAANLALAPVVVHDESSRVYVHVALIAVGFAMLVAGSNVFVDNAVELARLIGVSEAVIGLTLVAFGTSIPELATSALAAFRGKSDIAVGNVIGSNILNILSVLGLTALITPITSDTSFITDYLVMLAFSLILLPLAWTDLSLSRREGLFLLLAYSGYIAYAGFFA